MKNQTFCLITLILILTSSCNSPESRIKKDLSSRFTKFEIVEIKEDTANVFEAINIIRSLQIRALETSGEIITTLYKIKRETSNTEIYKDYLYVDSIHDNIINSLVKFENSRYDNDKVGRCYYVKYLLHKDELKIPKEEYYHLRLMANRDYDIIHRPYDWDEFLYEQKYNDIIKEVLKYRSEIYNLELKYKKH